MYDHSLVKIASVLEMTTSQAGQDFGFTDLTSEFKVLRVNSEDVSMPVELGQGKGSPSGRAFLLKPLFTAVIKVAS